jgi:nitrite reductase (NO-forming)
VAPSSSSPSSEIFFDPKSVTLSRGSTVTWINDDTTLRTVTSGSVEAGESGTIFDSSYTAGGSTFEWTFPSTGTFDYYCTLHPFITVLFVKPT